MMIGGCGTPGVARIRDTNVNPSMTGMSMSHNTASTAGPRTMRASARDPSAVPRR
jgi:hypothetical protein